MVLKYRKIGREAAIINTALVLSGGGARGAYQAGVIRQLLEMGIDFDLLIGTSIGALNAALLAEFIYRKLDRGEIAEQMEKAWYKFGKFMTLNCPAFINNLFTPFRIPSIYTNREIKKVLQAYIPPERRFSDYRTCQLSVTGTNLSRKRLDIFDFNSEVPVDRAVLASMAYPVAFPAIRIKGDYYVDGGALSNAPLKEAIQWGAREIYLVFLRPMEMIIRGAYSDESYYPALKVIEELLDLATHHLMYGDLEQAEKINKVIGLINRYQQRLPVNFLRELQELFGLKYERGKRIINICRIAPEVPLDPPGLRGFDNIKVIKRIMRQGEEDTRLILSRR
ncbi:MAG: patatin-like phospholipase family protein [Halanaerobiales bacterium]